ncbi:hypothetical protein WN55_10552 [Dufourea novaeangliae]|uniref:Uncharacterized protein n=1 Tax=Dufourea novaeangliae TaxID=178035 RepID=A0A154P440_DUFNO|nr:hypothetical protein WN55_10552 [Dufourea novaeangliae]
MASSSTLRCLKNKDIVPGASSHGVRKAKVSFGEWMVLDHSALTPESLRNIVPIKNRSIGRGEKVVTNFLRFPKCDLDTTNCNGTAPLNEDISRSLSLRKRFSLGTITRRIAGFKMEVFNDCQWTPNWIALTLSGVHCYELMDPAGIDESEKDPRMHSLHGRESKFSLDREWRRRSSNWGKVNCLCKLHFVEPE